MKKFWKFKVINKDSWGYWNYLKPFIIVTQVLSLIASNLKHDAPVLHRMISSLRVQTHMVK